MNLSTGAQEELLKVLVTSILVTGGKALATELLLSIRFYFFFDDNTRDDINMTWRKLCNFQSKILLNLLVIRVIVILSDL